MMTVLVSLLAVLRDSFPYANCTTRNPCLASSTSHPPAQEPETAPAERLALNDCDRYFDWRASGGYVTTFKVRSKEVTKRTRGGTRAVDLELIVLSNALSPAVRRGGLT